ncbi:MAG: PA14 domain-containing protein, partial [Planctomycetota bacterium]
MRVLLPLAALALAACGGAEPDPAPTSAGAVSAAATPGPAPLDPALLAVQEGGCASCHALGGDADTALRPAPAAGLASLVRRSGFEDRLHFAGDAGADVAAWMRSLGHAARDALGDLQAAPIPGGLVARGEQLVRELGCAACHDDRALQLSATTDHARLTAALASSGAAGARPPHVPLSRDEAGAVSAYLLRDQVREGQRGPGFAWRCFETPKGFGEWPDISSWTPAASGVVDTIGKEVATRGSNYLLEFTATLEVPTTGEWTFAIRSDDGGWIWVDGEQVAANPGMHPATRKQGSLQLTAGAHQLRVGFTQGGGGDVLEVFWSGPGVSEQPIPSSSAWTSVTSLVPPALQELAEDDAAVARGRAAARAARCDACHAVSEPAF